VTPTTCRDKVPDEIVDRQRDDTLRPPAASVTESNAGSEIRPSRWSSTDCALINKAAGIRSAFCAAICSVPSSCMLFEPMARLVLSASSAAESPNSSV
jgi:hypothetical protein